MILRLDRFLSEAGVASRRELKAIIRSGRVIVNGSIIRNPETKINSDEVSVFFDGKPVYMQGRVVLMLHKPAGYVTSTNDPKERTVMELLPPEYRELFPIGRLDKETEGLLLFTNDGDLGHRIISPRHNVEKEYFAVTEGQIDDSDVAAFAEGILLRDGTECLPAELRPAENGCNIVIREGKYHQVRRMLASRGKPVIYLRRIRVGSLTLDGLQIGQWRMLTHEEIGNLL